MVVTLSSIQESVTKAHNRLKIYMVPMLLSTISHHVSQTAGSDNGQVEVSDVHLSCYVFWDVEEGSFVDILPCAETINSDLYTQTLKTLEKHFK